MRLDQFDISRTDYTPGAGLPKQLLWFFVGQPLLRSYLLPFSGLKCGVLRMFGAQVGQGVRIKPGVRVKFPWRLRIGDHSWIGEDVWIDNLAPVAIGSHCCISQGAYFCTGSHDWSVESFDLRLGEIEIEDEAWVAARATLAPGVRVGRGAILGLAAVATRSLNPWSIYAGNPARKVKDRPRPSTDS